MIILQGYILELLLLIFQHTCDVIERWEGYETFKDTVALQVNYLKKMFLSIIVYIHVTYVFGEEK